MQSNEISKHEFDRSNKNNKEMNKIKFEENSFWVKDAVSMRAIMSVLRKENYLAEFVKKEVKNEVVQFLFRTNAPVLIVEEMVNACEESEEVVDRDRLKKIVDSYLNKI